MAISVYQLKPAFQARLRPLVKALAQWGITPNQVTCSAIGLSLLTGLVLWRSPQAAVFALPIVLLLRMGLNAIDGMIAREYHRQSALGGILNELGDVISDLALYLPLAIHPGISPTLLMAVLCLALISELAGILGPSIGAKRQYDGPLGKSDRAVVFSIMAILLGLNLPLGNALNLFLATLLPLSIMTTVNRIQSALQEVSAHALAVNSGTIE